MQIEITEEIQKIIISLCDLALKVGGLQNKRIVDKVLNIFNQDTNISNIGDKEKKE